MRQATFPESWDGERVRRVLQHHENQLDEEAVAVDEAASESTTHTAMDIPVELVCGSACQPEVCGHASSSTRPQRSQDGCVPAGGPQPTGIGKQTATTQE
jgi:hypothetical protein